MFLIQPMHRKTPSVGAVAWRDSPQQLFDFAEEADITAYYAEYLDNTTGVVVQSDIYEDPYHALYQLTTTLPEDLDLPEWVNHQ